MNKFIACEMRNGKHFVSRVLPTILACLVLIYAFKAIVAVGADGVSTDLSGNAPTDRLHLERLSYL